MQAYNAFGAEAMAADVMRGGEALHEAKTATSVRVRDGKVLVTDGPFAETKEEFGGFYLIEAPDLDEAIKWAAKIPGAARGTIEIRPGRRLRRRGRGGRGAGRHCRWLNTTGPVAFDAVDRIFREESGRVIAGLIRAVGDFDLAEESVQDAFVEALEHWPHGRHSAQSGRLDRDHRAAQGDRSPAPREEPRAQGRGACAAHGRRTRTTQAEARQ